jgi:hypothetical protein
MCRKGFRPYYRTLQPVPQRRWLRPTAKDHNVRANSKACRVHAQRKLESESAPHPHPDTPQHESQGGNDWERTAVKPGNKDPVLLAPGSLTHVDQTFGASIADGGNPECEHARNATPVLKSWDYAGIDRLWRRHARGCYNLAALNEHW